MTLERGRGAMICSPLWELVFWHSKHLPTTCPMSCRLVKNPELLPEEEVNPVNRSMMIFDMGMENQRHSVLMVFGQDDG